MTRFEQSVLKVSMYGSQFPNSNLVQHAAWHIWLTELKFDYFVTLTFPPDQVVSPNFIGERMRKLAHQATCEVYGKRAYKCEENEIVIFYFIERHKSGKFHVHALMHRPKGNFRSGKQDLPRFIRRRWRFLTGSRVNHIRKLWNEEDYSEVSWYCLKDTFSDKTMVETTKRKNELKVAA